MKSSLKYIQYDFHAETKGDNYKKVIEFIDSIKNDIDGQNMFICDQQSKNIIQKQNGIFRTNCVDCLDRTNVV